MSVLSLLAGETTAYEWAGSGWLWLLTPMKRTGELAVFDRDGQAVWYTPHVWGNNYLDLRVVVIDLILMIILMIVIPLILRGGRQTERPMVRYAGPVIGFLFGGIITYISLAAFTWWFTLSALGATALLAAVSVCLLHLTKVGPGERYS